MPTAGGSSKRQLRTSANDDQKDQCVHARVRERRLPAPATRSPQRPDNADRDQPKPATKAFEPQGDTRSQREYAEVLEHRSPDGFAKGRKARQAGAEIAEVHRADFWSTEGIG